MSIRKIFLQERYRDEEPKLPEIVNTIPVWSISDRWKSCNQSWRMIYTTIFFSGDLIQLSTMLRSLLVSNRKETHRLYLDFHVGSIKTLDVILWINSRLRLIFSYNLLLLCPKLAHIHAMRISFHCTPNKKIDLIKSSNFSRRLFVQQFDLRFFPILGAI